MGNGNDATHAEKHKVRMFFCQVMSTLDIPMEVSRGYQTI